MCVNAQQSTKYMHIEYTLWLLDSIDAPGHQLTFADTSSEIQSIALRLAVLTSSHFFVIVIGMNGLSDLIMGIVSGPECKHA